MRCQPHTEYSVPAYEGGDKNDLGCKTIRGFQHQNGFTLKPIRLSDDKKRLDMHLFWLAKRNHTSQATILQRPPLPVHLDQGPNVTKLFNVQTNEIICSGDQISLETDDPVAHPLPDLSLLDMQWVLHRVTAWSAAAEPQDIR